MAPDPAAALRRASTMVIDLRPGNLGVDASKVLDESRVTLFQYQVFLLCLMAVLIDGFDMQVTAFVAPAMLQDIHVARSLLGTLVSAGLFGMMLSGLLGGMLADKIGRRQVILGSLIFFGAATIAKGFSSTYQALLILQFLGGLGLGGAYMNSLALTAEYAPAKERRFIVTCISIAYPLGGIAAGNLTAAITPRFGWQPVFFCGGGAALILFVAACFGLPQSVRQLLLMRRSPEVVEGLMTRIAPSFPRGTPWVTGETSPTTLPIVEIFKDGRGALTCLLAAAVMVSLMSGYFVVSWSPMLLSVVGIKLSQAVIAGSMLQVGAVIGALIWGRLADQVWPPAVLAGAAMLSVVCYSLVGHATSSFGLLICVLFVGGMGMGVQNTYNSLISSLYPTAMRGTALGFIFAIARIGSITGPLIGGALLAAGWTTSKLYYVPASSLLVAIVCMVLVSVLPQPRRIISGSQAAAFLTPIRAESR